MKRILLALAALGLTIPALSVAAPPPSHPSLTDAGKMLSLPIETEMPFTATVLESHDSNNYTFVLVEDEDGQRWLAAPRVEVKPNSVVRHSDGTLMRNFHSKVLNRTFPGVFFVAAIQPE